MLGTMQPGGTFRAAEVLAKHDENYMPKDVADALKKRVLEPGRRSPQPAATWDTKVVKRTGEVIRLRRA